ncbi:MAG: LEA type 2 family protein [Desulfobacterales bacterium]|nr:MAG: LEA type 2 family protein [Desulfobacterales bacterium]
MQKKSIVLMFLAVFGIAVLLSGCAAMQKPTESNFKTPVVTLDYVDVAHYFGWWFYNNKVEPTKGKAGNNSAPLDYAFIFNIENPNSFPVMLNGLKFACVIDGFQINSGYSNEIMWIPAGKTNQLRVEVMYDFSGTQLSLLVVAGQELKAKGVGFMDQIEKIWTGAPDFSFPVGVTQGSAIFEAGGLTKVAAFEGTYPK